MLAYPDRQIKPLVCILASSGIRLSAWDYLKWKHIILLLRNGRIVAAKIQVYADDDEYFSFISQEALEAFAEWMNYRKACGEELLMRVGS